METTPERLPHTSKQVTNHSDDAEAVSDSSKPLQYTPVLAGRAAVNRPPTPPILSLQRTLGNHAAQQIRARSQQSPVIIQRDILDWLEETADDVGELVEEETEETEEEIEEKVSENDSGGVAEGAEAEAAEETMEGGGESEEMSEGGIKEGEDEKAERIAALTEMVRAEVIAQVQQQTPAQLGGIYDEFNTLENYHETNALSSIPSYNLNLAPINGNARRI